MGEELQLALLGNLEVRRDGVLVTGIRSNKALALLCYLAVTGRPHLRPTLAGLLWGDMPEASARNNLSKALTQLRQEVGGPPYLRVTRQAVAFDRDSPHWLDVAAFEEAASARADIDRLQDAVELYRGDFLEGFYVRRALAFEEWVLAQRARLREKALAALHTLAVHHARRGEAGHAVGIDYTTRLLALEPWREEAHRQLMVLLARSGQRGAALAQYETCRRVLSEELGVEPAKETVALYEKIRTGELEVAIPIPEPEITPHLPAFLEEVESERPARPVFVGRERELAQLDGYLEGALAGQGRVVFVSGEAGTGKTALVEEFARRAQARHADLVVAGGRCSAYTGVGDPYLPFCEIVGLLTGDVESRWAAGAIDAEQARRLWTLMPRSVGLLVKASPDLIDIFVSGPILAARAATAAPGGARWLDGLGELLASKERGQERADLQQTDLFEQVARLLTGLARQGPLLLAVDDLQWGDAGSINLLFHLGRRLEGSRVLMVGIYRPTEVALGRGGERHPLESVVGEFQRRFGRIEVGLRQSEDRQFVDALLDTEPNRLGVKFRGALYRHTQGHPLFTVEMLRGMQERGDLVRDEAGRWVEGPAVDWESLPARVEGAIGERVSRLPMTLQETLKVASVEGEEFTAEVVTEVRATGQAEMVGQLSSQLDRRHRLVRSQDIERLGPGGQRVSRYRFRHILFQRYVYNNLDKVERTYLHEAVGNALEGLYEGQTEAAAIQLARHFQAAGMGLKAIDYFQQAGEQAVRSYAFQDAVAISDQALALLETLPDTAERAGRELTLQLARGNAASIVGVLPKVGQAYARARELCQQSDAARIPELFPALWGLWIYYAGRAEHQVAREFAEQLLHLAQRVEDQSLLLQAYHALWNSLAFFGEFASAHRYMEQGLALYDPQWHRSHVLLYGGHDPQVCCLATDGLVLWFLGYPDQALHRSHEGLALAQELSHPPSLCMALEHLAQLYRLRREERAVQEQAQAAEALATEQGIIFYLRRAASLRGWALAQQGQGEAGIAHIQRSLATLQAGETKMNFGPHMLALLAEAYETVGQIEDGLSAVAEGLVVAHKTGESFCEPELHRLKGELLLRRGGGAAEAEAEACFHRAIAVARQQSARSLELRAVMSVSRLWQGQGKPAEARQVLAEMYGWFTEGFDTADLKEARALLDGM